MPAQASPPPQPVSTLPQSVPPAPPETAGVSTPAVTSETVGIAPTQASGKGGGGFILGFLIGAVMAVLVGVGVYLWQQDVGKRQVEAANAKVAACSDEKGKSLSAAEVWKDQFVKLSQSVNSSEWIAEHCEEVTAP